MNTSHVFIVGLPRTGTKLLMQILEGAPGKRFQISPETFFLGRFIKKGVRQIVESKGNRLDDTGVHDLVDMMCSGAFHGTYWNQLADGRIEISRSHLTDALLACDRTARGVFQVLMEVYADGGKGCIYGEKTPSHLYHVPRLLAWFPEAKIIHTTRDPRAILSSELLRRRKSRAKTWYSVLLEPFYSLMVFGHITFTWLYAVKLHKKYSRLYQGHYYLSRFEDLVDRAEPSVKQLSDYLGVEFHSDMLNPSTFGSSFERQSDKGFDKTTLSRWRTELQPWMQFCMSVLCRKKLVEFGYPVK